MLGALGILFVGLKLCGVIDWSWLWVTAPFWIGIALFALFMAVLGVAWLIVHLLSRKEQRRPKPVNTQNLERRGAARPKSEPAVPLSSRRQPERREPIVSSAVSRPISSGRREPVSSAQPSSTPRDDILSNPLHPLNPVSQTFYSAPADDTPTRSHCSSHSNHGSGFSDSSSYSSSIDSSCSSSSDSSSSSSSYD
ncbi:hypothetical protein ACIPL1_30705 [Pseudomonas sp. NPDC090202]|uniref:hypothetical protein n=1 Tax=Pseudomonas sp. NPDC090202 TaxID=3364476 RepID=UPI0037F73DF2